MIVSRGRWMLGLCGAVALASLSAHTPQQGVATVIRGTVRTTEGAPAGEIAVVLVPPAAAAGAPQEAAQCVATADGAFSFPPVVIDGHRLVVAPASIVSSCPDRDTLDQMRPRGLPLKSPSAGGAVTVNFVVAPDDDTRVVTASVSMQRVDAPQPGAALPPGAPRPPSMPGRGRGEPGIPVVTRPGAISGKLTDPDGKPLAGVPVQAVRRPSTNSSATLQPYGQAITAEDGSYRIANTPDGDIVVVALALRTDGALSDGSRPAVPAATDENGRRVGFHTTYYPGVATAAQARPVAVRGAEATGVDFVMRRSQVLKLSGRVTGLDTKYFPAGWLILRPERPIEHIGGRNVHRLDLPADGSFVLDAVAPGAYTMFVNTPSGWAHRPFQARAETTMTPLEIALQPHLTVSGTVKLDAARVIPEAATLGAIQVELRQVPRTTGSPLLRAPVAADGTFTIARVPGDRYSLTVASPTFWFPLSGTIDGRDTLDFPTDLRDSVTDAVLVLADRDTNLRGTVRALDNVPVMSARVVVYSEDAAFWTTAATRRVRVLTVGPGGSFGTAGMPPGDYLARAFPSDARITNAVLESSRATATRFSLAVGESRVVDLLLVR